MKFILIRSAMELSVIIVSYNVKYYLEQCICSVLKACTNINAEIIVIDNASADKSIEYLQSKFEQVQFIKLETNAGFAKANNIALQKAEGNYVLYLNPDTIIVEDVITNCIQFLNEHNEAGAVGVKMVDGCGKFLPESKRALPSLTASFFKLSGLAFLFPNSALFNAYALGNLDENKIHKVAVLSGAFFFTRKNILHSLNGFDEDFFMYGEDIDLGYRIQKAGFSNYYLGTNAILHFKGESTVKDKAYVKNFYTAMKIFVQKHYQETTSFFFRCAIQTVYFFSFGARIIKKPFTSTLNKKNKKFILLGDEDAVNSAAAILKANNLFYNIVITGNDIAPDKEPEAKKLFSEEINSTPCLVFCINKLSYGSCIQFIQTNKNKYKYYWHYKGSGSIVTGSNSSSFSQIYIAI
jgi:N-acetylglucosaminyl-diphospho-decaprenol L-rhamnosyltransferase